MFEEIRTKRLTLRALENRDAQRIFEYRSSHDVYRFQSWGTDSAHVIESYVVNSAAGEPGTPGPWYQIGITQSPTELIGDCAFRILESEPRQARLCDRSVASAAGLFVCETGKASRLGIGRSEQSLLHQAAPTSWDARRGSLHKEPLVQRRMGRRRDLCDPREGVEFQQHKSCAR